MKSRLFTHCIALAKEKVRNLETELESTREATTSEGKSTAGDKHETGRAMMHLEQEKLHKQLGEAQALVAELERIEVSDGHNSVQIGSIVETSRATFILAVGLGKVHFEGNDYFAVSAQSPVAQQMMGRNVGESFVVNATEYVITAIK
jgi:transcription elongation GreA/GreB family factor